MGPGRHQPLFLFVLTYLLMDATAMNGLWCRDPQNKTVGELFFELTGGHLRSGVVNGRAKVHEET